MLLEENEELRELLELDTIAVVGCSATPGKAAHEVPASLRRHGYEIIPVNPFRDEIFEREPCISISLKYFVPPTKSQALLTRLRTATT